MPLHEDVIAGGDAANVGEFRGVVLNGGILPRLVERGRLDNDAERRSILRRKLVEIIGRLEAARARHVLRDDRRLPGNMLAEMARDQTPVEIVAAACGVADDDGDGPARKELLDRLG